MPFSGRYHHCLMTFADCVLILVLLDALFRVGNRKAMKHFKEGLNPCFTGCPFQGRL